MKKAITFKSTPVTIKDPALKVGDAFPAFKATKQDLSDFNLSDYAGKVVVVNAFPSIDTGVCQMQTTKFNQELKEVPEVVVVTVSKDLPFALDRFCSANGIENVVTVSDYKYREFEVNVGGLIEELQLLARMVYVVDQTGVVRYAEICEEVANEPDYTAAVAVVRSLI